MRADSATTGAGIQSRRISLSRVEARRNSPRASEVVWWMFSAIRVSSSRRSGAHSASAVSNLSSGTSSTVTRSRAITSADTGAPRSSAISPKLAPGNIRTTGRWPSSPVGTRTSAAPSSTT
jgi:hypothetical protein